MPAERQAAFDAMGAILAQEVPYSPLYWANQGFLLQPSVQGWRSNRLRTVDWRAVSLGSAK